MEAHGAALGRFEVQPIVTGCSDRLIRTLSWRRTMFACSAWPSRPTSSLDKHVSSVCAACSYWLRQLRRVHGDTCPRLCHIPGGLLQHGTRWYTDVFHWQTAAGTERRCTPSSAERASTNVRSWTVAAGTRRSQLDVLRYQRTTLDRRAFAVAGPTVWNSLTDEFRDETENTFRQLLKTLFFRQY